MGYCFNNFTICQPYFVLKGLLYSPIVSIENAAFSKGFTILPEPNLGKTPPLFLVFPSLEYC